MVHSILNKIIDNIIISSIYKLIFGKDLSGMNLYTRSNEKDLSELVKIFKDKWIPSCEKGDFDFKMLVKQTFWLVENEQRTGGINPPHGWKKLRDSMKFQLASLEAAKTKLVDFSHVKYMDIVQKLTLDVRIFLGANAFIFILMFLVSFMRPQAIKHLFLPGGLMLISTVMCSYFYLFEQNWFYTIIYNNYTGFSFIGYLVFVFGILCDIVFNKARITTEVINACLNAIGSVGSLAPC